jgi:hypothetical protein
MPEDALGLSSSQLQSVGKTSREFHHCGVEKRRAKLQAVGHAAAISFRKKVIE